MTRCLLVIPPMGGARLVALQVEEALRAELHANNVKTIDSGKYLAAFKTMMPGSDEETMVDFFNQQIIIQCLDFDASILLVPALAPVTPFALNLLRKQGVKTVHWFFEDYRRAGYWRDVIDGYDLFCAIQRGPVEAECRRKNISFLFLPTATGISGDAPLPYSSERKHDVAFIGIPSHYRIDILEKIQAEGISLIIGGEGWDRYRGPLEKQIAYSKWIEGDVAKNILASAKIGLNLSVDSPTNDFENTHLSPRIYDVIMRGLVLVTEDVPLCREYLEGLQYHTFSTSSSTDRNPTSIIRQLLGNYSEEAKMMEENRQNVLSEHTYRNRIRTLLTHFE